MSGPLVPAGSATSGSHAFQQTGTLNWVDLSSKTVSFAIGALNRLSKANIHPDTVAMSRIMFRRFVMPVESKKAWLDRIAHLPQVNMYGKVARFGFGLQHVLDEMAEFEDGLSAIALCSCLTATYPLFYAAQVLREICLQQNTPEDMVPGTKRWLPLLEICSGIVSGTKFYASIDGLSRLLGHRTPNGTPEFLATNHESLATALLLLAQISCEELECCTFSGGVDCAWLGAVAEHLFNISVSIIRGDGIVAYESAACRRTQSGGCRIVLLQGNAATSELTLTRKSFYVPGGQSFFRVYSDLTKHARFENHSQWGSILEDSFGSASKDLLDGRAANDFARLFVYAARRSAMHNDGPNFFPVMQDGTAFSTGNDLLDFACWRLPELKPCLQAIGYRDIITIAEEEADSHVQALFDACNGVSCCNRRGQMGQDTCLLSVAAAIVRFVLLLSVATIDDISPTTFGVRQLYVQWGTLGSRQRNANFMLDLFGPKGHSILDICSLFGAGNSYPSTGGEVRTGAESLAVSFAGICAFYDILVHITSPPATAARVHIMPGHIEYKGSTFRRIEQLDLPYVEWRDFSLSTEKTFEILVMETATDVLEVAYSTTRKSIGPACMFSIWKIVSLSWKEYVHTPVQCGQPLRCRDWKLQCTVEPRNLSHIISNCGGIGYKSAALSLFLIQQESDKLKVHKTSSKLWHNSNISIEHLYAEYGRKYSFSADRSYKYYIATVSDCLRCIMTYVGDIVSYVWEVDESPLNGILCLYGLANTREEVEFQLTPKLASSRFK